MFRKLKTALDKSKGALKVSVKMTGGTRFITYTMLDYDQIGLTLQSTSPSAEFFVVPWTSVFSVVVHAQQ
jgi:hypothetical protein